MFEGAHVAGVDEVGRGPLAGPVVAGASCSTRRGQSRGCATRRNSPPRGATNSRPRFRERAHAWALGRAEVAEIDRINILRAALVAMRRAVEGLPLGVRVAYIDGNIAPTLPCASVAVVGGDARVPAISAASIIAKVARDGEMAAAATRYPGYGFECHKGYATAAHLDSLRRLGPTPLHRRTFAPVALAAGDVDAPRQTTLWTHAS